MTLYSRLYVDWSVTIFPFLISVFFFFTTNHFYVLYIFCSFNIVREFLSHGFHTCLILSPEKYYPMAIPSLYFHISIKILYHIQDFPDLPIRLYALSLNLPYFYSNSQYLTMFCIFIYSPQVKHKLCETRNIIFLVQSGKNNAWNIYNNHWLEIVIYKKFILF